MNPIGRKPKVRGGFVAGFHVNVSAKMLKALDAKQKALGKDREGQFSRSDLIREILRKALGVEE